jgi:hypothetical protein
MEVWVSVRTKSRKEQKGSVEEGKEMEECVDVGPVIMLINVTGYHVSAGRTSLRLCLPRSVSRLNWVTATAGVVLVPLRTSLIQGLFVCSSALSVRPHFSYHSAYLDQLIRLID